MRPVLGLIKTTLLTATSGLAGSVADSRSLPGGLIAFSAQCILSNAGCVPSASPVYAFGWNGALPLSLTFAVVGAMLAAAEANREGSRAAGEGGAGVSELHGARSDSTLTGVGIGFAIATAASLLGVAAAHALAARARGARRMEGALAAQVAGVMTATYVGGSANFAQVARRVRLAPAMLGALAAADIGTMGVYFGAVSALAQSARAAAWFEGPTPRARARPAAQVVEAPGVARPRARWHVRLGGGALASACAVLALVVARPVDLFAGSATLAAVASASGMGVLVARTCPAPLVSAASAASALLAPLCLNFFFAAVGGSAHASEVAAAGVAGLSFVGTALSLHVLLLMAGGYALNRSARARRLLGLRRPLRLQELLVGSNAAIGGPSTAAAFAGTLGAGLVVPAALWGVGGYAVGTSLGVGMWALLS